MCGGDSLQCSVVQGEAQQNLSLHFHSFLSYPSVTGFARRVRLVFCLNMEKFVGKKFPSS